MVSIRARLLALHLPFRRRVGAPRSQWAHPLLLAGLVGLSSVGCTAGGANPSSAPQSAAASVPNATPTKASAAFQATPLPAIVVGDCQPGDVTAKLLGYGPAMGTMYIGLGITPTHGSCSLPAAPKATGVDAAGSRFTVGAAPDLAPGSRVAVMSQGLVFRIGVNSWCESTKLQTLDLVLDRGAGLEVSVALPADFTVACSGSATRLTIGAPVEP